MKQMSVFALALMAWSANATEAVAEKCSYDREAMLALDQQAFDQDLAGGGWRRIADIQGCELAAAELISTYRAKHQSSAPILIWHEGQMLAMGGMNERAAALLEGTKRDPAQDVAGWNHYVDATVAFLRGDMAQLERSRAALSAIAYPANPGMPPLKDGYVEFPTREGQPPARVRWPPNVEVVDGLVRCFGKPYREAYGASCRAGEP